MATIYQDRKLYHRYIASWSRTDLWPFCVWPTAFSRLAVRSHWYISPSPPQTQFLKVTWKYRKLKHHAMWICNLLHKYYPLYVMYNIKYETKTWRHNWDIKMHASAKKMSLPVQDHKTNSLPFFTDGRNSSGLLHPDRFSQLHALQ